MADKKVLHSLTEMRILLESWGLTQYDWILTGQYVYGLLGYEVSVRKGHHNVLVRKDKITWSFPDDALEVYPPVGSKKEKQFRRFMQQTGFEFDLIPLRQVDFNTEKKSAIPYKLPNGLKILMQEETGQLRILENILEKSHESGWGKDKGRRILGLVAELADVFDKAGKPDLAKLHSATVKRFSPMLQADEQLAELLKTQKSLTEWLDDIKHKDAEAIRREDNNKRERLKVLNEIIGLPFDKPVQFEAADLKNQTARFKKYLKEHGQELCALRLIPKVGGLEKLRMRGITVDKAYDWFLEQNIDAGKYRADFMPHPPDYSWATIFVINKHGIQGEIIWGGHHQLTQGFHNTKRPHIFRYDFKKWMIEPRDDQALAHLKILAGYLKVDDKAKQAKLKSELNAEFTHDYLEGYFESADSSLGIWFLDYSPALGKMYEDMVVTKPAPAASSAVSGLVGSPGEAKGPVKIVEPGKVSIKEFPDGGVLVCAVTTPAYVPLMQKASAIVTDQGGILSHAAIVARELKKPCIVGTGNATKILKNGQIVSVDAGRGLVNPL